jgi:uncharacterized membrane protein
MREEGATAERLAAYADAVFAVIVTILVLELKPPTAWVGRTSVKHDGRRRESG